MTKAATATQAQIKRHVKAAYGAGATAVAIRPDGTVVAYREGDNPLVPTPYRDAALDGGGEVVL